jgi:zinc protease
MSGRFFFEPGPGLGFIDVVLSFDLGAETDPPDREGCALLAARTIRCGTTGRTRAQVDAEVERLGATLEAGAGHHRLSVRGRVIRENVAAFADLATSLVLEPAMREEDFEQQRRLLSSEHVAMRDDDQDLAGRAFRRALFAGHPAGRPASGTIASLERIPLEACRDVPRRLMARDTLLVGVAGDIEESEARRLLVDPLRRLPERAAAVRPEIADPPRPRGRRVLLVDKPERTQTQIYLGHLGPRPGAPLHDGLFVSSVAFGGTFSGRLMQKVRVERGWSYGAYSRLVRSRRDDAFYLWTFPANGDAGPCITLELAMLGDLARDGITAEELAFARGYVAGSSIFLVDTPADRLERRLDVEVLGFPTDYYTGLRHRIDAVTLQEARAATATTIDPGNLVVAVLCTAAAVKDAVRSAVGEDVLVEVIPFDDETL